jgi:hypothetical protein
MKTVCRLGERDRGRTPEGAADNKVGVNGMCPDDGGPR